MGQMTQQQCQSTEGSSSPKVQASVPPGPPHHVTVILQIISTKYTNTKMNLLSLGNCTVADSGFLCWCSIGSWSTKHYEIFFDNKRSSYDLLLGTVSMSSAAFLILVNSMLCIVAIYAAVYWSSDVLGLCLLLQSTGMFSILCMQCMVFFTLLWEIITGWHKKPGYWPLYDMIRYDGLY